MLEKTIKQKELFHDAPLKPILKWAGGKQQLLPEILERIPENYNRFIEPFVGGGAVYFAIPAKEYIISDSNPELINLYKTLPDHVEDIIEELERYRNDEKFYYEIRALNVKKLTKVKRAARFLYLNRTCFNGLYRVNQKGEFNVPFGKYKNPKIVFPKRLRKAAKKLKNTRIYHSDYSKVLIEHAEKGDFIFLDPPYIPISEYSDFKRYTKDQFRLEDQKNLANLVKKLAEKGCKMLLTNSNHSLVHELYGKFEIEVISTKRNINSNAKKRTGEDVIVSINV